MEKSVLSISFCLFISPLNSAPLPVILSLEEAVDAAVSVNDEIRMLRFEEKMLSQKIKDGRRAYYPVPSVELTRNRNTVMGGEDHLSSEVRFSLHQTVYDGGQRTAQTEFAELNLKARRAEMQFQKKQIRLEMRRAFYELLGLQAKASIAELSLKRSGKTVQQMVQRESLGFATQQNVLQASSGFREIESRLNELKSSRNKIELNLKHALKISGLPVLRENLLSDIFLRPPFQDHETLVRSAESRSPELKGAKAQVRYSKTQLDQIRSGYIPRLDVTAYAGRRGINFPVRERTWGLNFQLSFPFADAPVRISGSPYSDSSGKGHGGGLSSSSDPSGYGMKRSRQLAAEFACKQAILKAKNAQRSIRLSIDKISSDLHSLWKAIHSGNARLYLQYRNVQISAKRLEEGEIFQNEHFQEEIRFLEANEFLIESILSYMNAASELAALSGLEDPSAGLVEILPGRGNLIYPHILKTMSPALSVIIPDETEVQDLDADKEIILDLEDLK